MAGAPKIGKNTFSIGGRNSGEKFFTPSPFTANPLRGKTVDKGIIFAESRKMRFSKFEFLKGSENRGTQRRTAETCQ